MTQTITSLEGFARKIRAVTPANDEVLVYRGHSDRRKFKLIPFILREQKFKDAEETILRELVASHPAEFSSDSSTLEQLARVQHYSLPTRLLDITWNPLVALYFAAKHHDNVTGGHPKALQKARVTSSSRRMTHGLKKDTGQLSRMS